MLVKQYDSQKCAFELKKKKSGPTNPFLFWTCYSKHNYLFVLPDHVHN